MVIFLLAFAGAVGGSIAFVLYDLWRMEQKGP